MPAVWNKGKELQQPVSWDLIDFRLPIPNLHLIDYLPQLVNQTAACDWECKRQAHEIQILLRDAFEVLDALCEVGNTQIYSFNKFVSSMCQDTISGKSDTVFAFMKLTV